MLGRRGNLVSSMTRAAAHPPELCARFHRARELIGRRWTGAIIFVLLKSRCRFATLRDAIPDITDRMLSDRLQELEQEGILERTVIPDTPVRVEYALTKKGHALGSAVDAIADWAHKWSGLEAADRATRPARARRSAPSGR
jgi:DNA-binding HxlR family transcriptional regulator